MVSPYESVQTSTFGGVSFTKPAGSGTWYDWKAGSTCTATDPPAGWTNWSLTFGLAAGTGGS
jgi:hypothetical protein